MIKARTTPALVLTVTLFVVFSVHEPALAGKRRCCRQAISRPNCAPERRAVEQTLFMGSPPPIGVVVSSMPVLNINTAAINTNVSTQRPKTAVTDAVRLADVLGRLERRLGIESSDTEGTVGELIQKRIDKIEEDLGQLQDVTERLGLLVEQIERRERNEEQCE